MLLDDIIKPDQRKSLRVKFQEPVQYHFKEAKNFGGCLAYDLGIGGIRVNFHEFVPPQTEIKLQLQLGQNQKLVDLMGHVVWVQKIPYSERYQVGVEFKWPDFLSSSKNEIFKYIHSQKPSRG